METILKVNLGNGKTMVIGFSVRVWLSLCKVYPCKICSAIV